MLNSNAVHKKMSFSEDLRTTPLTAQNIALRGLEMNREKSNVSSMSSAVTKAASPRHIPRPRNAFILFRQHMHRKLFPKLTKDKQKSSDNSSSFKTNSECSREIGQKWRNLDPEEKKYWNELARKEKEWHRMKYPNYKYTPTKKNANSSPLVL